MIAAIAINPLKITMIWFVAIRSAARLRQRRPVAAVALRTVERAIGTIEQAGQPLAAALFGNAEADSHRQFGRDAGTGAGDRAAQRLDTAQRRIAVVAPQQQSKFLTADPPNNVLLAECGLEMAGDAAERVVTDRMAVQVVDRLEQVDVGDCQRHRASRTPCPAKRG